MILKCIIIIKSAQTYVNICATPFIVKQSQLAKANQDSRRALCFW